MASSTSIISMAFPLTTASHNNLIQPSPTPLFNPLPKRTLISQPLSKNKGAIQASLKENTMTLLTTASMVIPDAAHAAAGSDLSPSLQSFLFSVFAGGVVLGGLFGAVLGVANFDPVKRS